MENTRSSLPDVVIPYCRELFNHFQTDIEHDPKKRDAIIWIADLMRVVQTLARKVLERRKKRIATAKTVTAPVSDEIVDVAQPDDEEEPQVPTPTQAQSRPPHPQATATAPVAKTPAPQKAIKESDAQAVGLTPPSALKRTRQRAKRGYKPFVGDWKCFWCERWQRKYHANCRTRNSDTETGFCKGTRLIESDVLAVQDDNGEHLHPPPGNMEHCGTCTTLTLDAEYVMDDEDELEDKPPTPPRADRTAKQKRDSYFKANGRFMDHSKPKY
ncbi:hypothetical protein E8E11_011728 [Didymella keratinophila]|nr:hypothetical protein E8E11_011728 [Didymella keratinophila]